MWAVRIALNLLCASIAVTLAVGRATPGWVSAGQEPALLVDPQPNQPQRRAADSAALAGTLPPGADRERHPPKYRVTRSAVRLPDGTRAVLRLPVAAGPVPGVVLVHGSGPGTRHSMTRWARRLAASGVAVVSYDKRPAGYTFRVHDYRALAKDAVLAAELLAAQSGVDRARLGIFGFSEGTWVAPLALTLMPGRFRFLVIVSAPVVTPHSQIAWSVDRLVEWAPSLVRRAAALLVADGRGPIDYLDFDARPSLAAVDIPVYAVWGDRDGTVPVTVAVRALAAALRVPFTAVIVPRAGHLVGGGGWIDDLASWMIAPRHPEHSTLSGVAPRSRLGLAHPPDPHPLTTPALRVAITVAVTAILTAFSVWLA